MGTILKVFPKITTPGKMAHDNYQSSKIGATYPLSD
jgi:hypothetical protein